LPEQCNLFWVTVQLSGRITWSGGRYTCVQMVLILRGIAQGVPTEHLADELGIDRSHLLAKRHEIQKLLEQRLSPLALDR
jgi:hypothetical protein